MKLKLVTTTFIFLLSSVIINAQDMRNQFFVSEGIKQLELGNLEKADTLFNAALEVYPNVDAYFNKALTRLNLNDQCGFCECMYMASFYEDMEADSLYKRYCISEAKMLESKYDSLVPFLINKQYEIIQKDKCGTREKIDFYNQNDSLLSSLQIINGQLFYSQLSYPARYPGGQPMLDKFIEKNMIYPKQAEAEKIQGKVYASFVVDENGRVKDARIVNGVNPLLDEEALRVISLIPKWYPATNKGKPVRDIITLNVNFSF